MKGVGKRALGLAASTTTWPGMDTGMMDASDAGMVNVDKGAEGADDAIMASGDEEYREGGCCGWNGSTCCASWIVGSYPAALGAMLSASEWCWVMMEWKKWFEQYGCSRWGKMRGTGQYD